MPSRPRGDAKERTFNLLIREGIDPQESLAEEKLIGSLLYDLRLRYLEAQKKPPA